MPTFESSTRAKLPSGHESFAGNGGQSTLELRTDFACYFGTAYSVYTKNANRWVIGGEYLHKKYDYKDMHIPVEQFTAEGGYYLKLLSDRRKTFFLSLGLSTLAGYETSN